AEREEREGEQAQALSLETRSQRPEAGGEKQRARGAPDDERSRIPEEPDAPADDEPLEIEVGGIVARRRVAILEEPGMLRGLPREREVGVQVLGARDEAVEARARRRRRASDRVGDLGDREDERGGEERRDQGPREAPRSPPAAGGCSPS